MNRTTALPPGLVAQASSDTPLGRVTLAASDAGLAGLWFEAQKYHPGSLELPADPAQRWIAQALDELARYWRGELQDFAVPLDLQGGSNFQRGVWRALRAIGRGRTTSYGELASGLGRATAVRAVAAAVGRNPLSIVLPCHRVLGRDGALTGYAGGLARKRALLQLEGVAI